MNLKMKIFVINLEDSVDRWQKIKSQLELQNLEYERISALDLRRQNNKHLIAYYNRKKNYFGYKRDLSLGEIGCYLSHRECWKRIWHDEIEFAIILEDDIRLIGDLNEVIHSLNTVDINYWEYLKIGETPIKRSKKTAIVKGKFSFVRYRKLPSGTFAQIVNKSGAKKLLENSQDIYRPVDIDIQYTWENKLNAFGLLPYCVDAILEESDIDCIESKEKYSVRPLIQIKNILEERFHLLKKNLF